MSDWRCRIGLHQWSRWGSAFMVCREHYVWITCYLDEVSQRWCQRCNRRQERVLGKRRGRCAEAQREYEASRG